MERAVAIQACSLISGYVRHPQICSDLLMIVGLLSLILAATNFSYLLPYFLTIKYQKETPKPENATGFIIGTSLLGKIDLFIYTLTQICPAPRYTDQLN